MRYILFIFSLLILAGLLGLTQLQAGENNNGLLMLQRQVITITDVPDDKTPIWLVIEPDSSFVSIVCLNRVHPTPGCIIKDIAPRPVGTILTIQCEAKGAHGLSQACKIGPIPGSHIQMLDFFYMAHLDNITLIYNGDKWSEISRSTVTPRF
jgi:hypothetical protein